MVAPPPRRDLPGRGRPRRIRRAGGREPGRRPRAEDPWCTNKGLTSTGRLARDAGDLDRAAARFQEALALAVKHGFELAVASCLRELGGVAAARGDCLRAARLLGAADTRRRAVGGVVHPCDRPGYDHDLAGAEAGLGPEAFAEAFAEGQTMPLEELV